MGLKGRIAARALSVVAAATLATTPPAGAADARDQARARLRAGIVLMEQGDYATALSEFEAAYGLVPNPKIQFNIGSAREALARYAAAHEAYTAFLADPQDAPADTVAKARSRLDALEKKVARIAVTSDQADDRIFVDGYPRGATPLANPIVVDAGAHAVTVKRGEASFADNVLLAEGEKKTVTASFPSPRAPEPEPGRVVPVLPVATDKAAGRVAEPAPDLRIERAPEPAPAPAPIYRRLWFWALVAGGVLAGAAAIAFALRPTDYPAANKTITLP